MLKSDSRRRFGRLLVAFVAAATVVSATQASNGVAALPERAPAENLTAERLRIAIPGAENNLTPFTITFGATPNTHDFLMLAYDSLFWSQVKTDPDPWLAENAEPNDDFTSWTVTMKPDLTWQDGTPLTAEDVLFTFEYFLVQKGASGRYAHHVFDVPPFSGGEVIDPLTVRLDFSAPAPQFRSLPGADLPIIPKHQWENVTDPKTMVDLPIGSGPYQVVEIQPDQLYRLKANPSYMMGKPTVDELELVIVKDPAAAFAALQTGDVDMVARNVPPELRSQFQEGDDVAMVAGSKFESTQIYFNARKAPLNDPVLRKAISMSTDLQEIVDTVLLGQGIPGYDTFIHPDSPWASPTPGHEYDVDAAAQALDDAGYVAGDDGVRASPDGTRLEFIILVNSFEPGDIRAAQLVAEQALAVGVQFNVESLDPATLRERRASTVDAIPAYDAYVSTLEAHAHVDPDGLYYFFHSPGGKGFGVSVSGFTNSTFDGIVEGAAIVPLDERADDLHSAEEILAEEIPGMSLWYRTGEYAYRPEAYGGWVSDPGHGIFTKRSFLPDSVNEAHPAAPAVVATTDAPATEATEVAASPDATVAAEANTDTTPTAATVSNADNDASSDDGGNGAVVWVIVIVVVAALALALFMRRRRSSDGDDD